ncbi:MAG: HAD family hydrolase [Nitrospira sp.]|nr:MAG: HAD family hydrolase [Nitrospira sp.]
MIHSFSQRRSMNRWKAIVFDLDDVLFPERSFVLSGFRAAAQWGEEHLRLPSEESFAELTELFDQGVCGKVFDRWLLKHGRHSKEHIVELIAVYRNHEPALSPYPEVPPLLEELRKQYRIGLMGDGYLDVQRRKLEALGLAPYFDTVLFSDSLGRAAWKPSTIPYQIIVDKLGVSAQETVYVGDNPMKDFVGARELGLYTIRIRRPGGQYSAIEPPTEQHEANLTLSSTVSFDAALHALPQHCCDGPLFFGEALRGRASL